jgi:valyl-tRNA synthetase
MRKLWNASKLVDDLTPAERLSRPDLREIDRWLLAELDDRIETVTGHFERREFSKARDSLRSFFWHTFCDDYLEIAKQRLRDGEDRSAAYTLQTAHRRFCKLFAPILAHVTEELWRDMYGGGSVHTTDWPDPLGVEADLPAGERAMAVVAALRKYKTDHQLSMNAGVDAVRVYGDVSAFADDIRRVMHVDELESVEEEAPVESVVTGIDLDYSLVGPEFGSQVGDIEAALAEGDYEIEDGRLHAAGVELDPEMFDIEEERQYTGDGEMVEAGETVVIVRN